MLKFNQFEFQAKGCVSIIEVNFITMVSIIEERQLTTTTKPIVCIRKMPLETT